MIEQSFAAPRRNIGEKNGAETAPLVQAIATAAYFMAASYISAT